MGDGSFFARSTWTSGAGRWVSVALVVIAIVTGLPAAAAGQSPPNQTLWQALPAFDSDTGPAISGHSDRRLHAVGVAFNGLVASTVTSGPGGWDPWQVMGPAPTGLPGDPAFYADPLIQPLLLRDGNLLHLFVSSKGGDLYGAMMIGGGAWSSWVRLTTDRHIKGRISVAITSSQSGDDHLHVLYRAAGDTVEYRRFQWQTGSWTQDGGLVSFPSAVEGTIGSDGGNQLLAVIRGTDGKLHLHKKLYPWDASWRPFDSVTPTGAEGDFFDISSVVYFGGEFHVAYAVKYKPDDISTRYAHGINHLRVPLGGAVSIHPIDSYNPVSEFATDHPKIELTVYRNKLVAAYRDVAGWVRYSRWDNADPRLLPWVGGDIIDGLARTDHRPALGWLNRRPSLTAGDYASSSFGHDLFAAITRTGTTDIAYVNFSRAIFTREVNAQFAVYDSNSGAACRSQSDPDGPPTFIADIGADGRPLFTELGYVLWTMPHWYIGDFYKRAGTIGCEAGNTSGRYDPDPTCAETRYPLVVFPSGVAFICNGVWLPETVNYDWYAFHELTHAMSGMLGFSDKDNEPPVAINQAWSGLPLAELTKGFTIFGESINPDCLDNTPTDTCPDTRKTGFTNYGDNYDVSTRQHSFIAAFYYYFFDGGAIRDMIDQDLQNMSDLLERKYNWVRDNIFQGQEFNKHSEPYLTPLPVPVGKSKYIYGPRTYARTDSDPAMARPVGSGPVVDGGDHVGLELGTLAFAGPVDYYVLVYAPAYRPDTLVLKPNLKFQPVSAGLVALGSNSSDPINRSLLGDLPVSKLLPGTYYVGLLVTAPGDLSNRDLWITGFVIP